MQLSKKIDTLKTIGIPYTEKGITYTKIKTTLLPEWSGAKERIFVSHADKNLSSVTLPYGVEVIGKRVFGESKVKEVILPETLTWIEPFAFTLCGSLEKINLENVNYISESAFSYTALKEITLRNVTVCSRAFSSTSHLQKVTMENVLLEQYAFISSAFHSIDLRNVHNVFLPAYVFMSNKNIEHLTIPPHICTISTCSCAECKNLQSVEIQGDNVRIEDGAFHNCARLSDVNLSRVSSINSKAFLNCAVEEADLRNCMFVADHAFEGCTNLHTVRLPNNLLNVRMLSFGGCNNVRKVYVPHDLCWDRVQELTKMFPSNPKYIVPCVGSTSKYFRDLSITCEIET